MQTVMNNSQLMQSLSTAELYPVGNDHNKLNSLSQEDKSLNLKALYRQLFKENRDLNFHHDPRLESLYLNGNLTTRELVGKLLNSDMFLNYIFATNSNFRFVELCFERVLGRKASQSETYQWSSLLTSQGLPAFTQQLVNGEEYTKAFGDNLVPFRRSREISSSNQGMPALPKELSRKRYLGDGVFSLPFYGLPPAWVLKGGAVLIVAGGIEIARIILTVAWSAFGG